ncbi:MAG TPA: amino acid ABC transporter substrate-binding protein [Aggregatilinea sp.]|uniref:amino acid ABC transporter substrate-binding protein n=1 Tax=Aggregatilinea sp. TaxID=2806333 RepID=UPI002C4B457C|nr:amino acid ABC transporter substrate-binding protein [Aggregatilinea sp.]HML21091.1 amino acid ABC transporter substrate-binding protein [Aggregatilinea sp.]
MKRFSRAVLLAVLTFALIAAFSFPAVSFAQDGASGKLQEVLDRGVLNCGVNGQLPGFAALNPDTNVMEGFDADFCRAVAAAIFGEVTDQNVNFVQLTAQERFTAVQTGQVDVLFRNTTETFSRDTELGLDFGPTTFYDGQGLMVRADAGVSSIDDLNGASICTLTGTTTELNITEAMESRGLEYELVPFEQSSETIAAFEEGRCDVLTSDRSQLAGLRSNASDPGSMILLEDVISKEPLGPAYLAGDSQWGDVINWTVYATIQAEEFGISSENVGDFLSSDNEGIQRFLGQGDAATGSLVGLDNDFVVNVITAVGNYGEIFDRNVGPDSDLGLSRGQNALWTDGGLMYSPPWR